MKKFLALLAFIVAGIGVWAGYSLWEKQQSSGDYYAEKVNLALRNNEPQAAFDAINQGIDAFPQRLDLRFGKIYMCQMIADYKCMKDEILRVVDFAGNSGQAWMWLQYEPNDTAFMLSVILNYLKILWDAGKDGEIKEIADEILNYFPDHVESLNMAAVSYLVQGDWENAEPYLQNARKLAPEDQIVQKNLQKLQEMKSASAKQK